jgi:hypothetical protein
MTQSDPDSSKEYDPYELFTEELDLESFDLEQPPPGAIAEASFSTPDEDRLYTDELIRQNESASRSLFLSVIVAALISVGIGLWYLFTQQKPALPPTAPLPVPEQPPNGLPPELLAPLPPSAPISPNPNLPSKNPGVLPGNLPPNNSALPLQPSPGGVAVSPTNRPTLPAQPNPSAVPPPPPVVPENPGR